MKTIDIRTTQNVTIEYELATLRERILAFFIDTVIVYVFLAILYFLVRGGFREMLWQIENYGLIMIVAFSFLFFTNCFLKSLRMVNLGAKKQLGSKSFGWMGKNRD